MAFEQVDGNKNILIREDGSVRRGLTNIEPDYEYDEEGNIDKDKWPTIVVQSDSEGSDRRLLPAEVLKLHGDLPANGHYTADMFDAEDGDKTNCEKDNIIFEGDNVASSPYKGKPSEEDQEDEGAEKDEGEKSPKSETTGRVVDDPTKKAPEGDSQEDQEANESGNKIKGQSGDYNADVAIEIIKNNTVNDLKEVDFVNEDDIDKPRQTVKDAWTKKQKEAAEESDDS